MDKKFKHGDRVYHKNLKQYGFFIGYAWESEEECDVNFETEDGEMEQKHVSVGWLEPAQKIYNKKVMEALRQSRGLEHGDTSQEVYRNRMCLMNIVSGKGYLGDMGIRY